MGANPYWYFVPYEAEFDAALQKFVSFVKDNFGTDDSVVRQTMEKRKKLSGMLGIANGRVDEKEFLHYLVERAAILVK